MKVVPFLFLFCQLYAQRMAVNDRWLSTNGTVLRYDTAEHLVGSAGLYWSARLLGADDENSFSNATLVGFLWEVKDSLYDYERFGSWGGEGFSIKDFIADVIGVYVGRFIWNHTVKRMLK